MKHPLWQSMLVGGLLAALLLAVLTKLGWE